MYRNLVEEITSLIPTTPAQKARIASAEAECGNWTFSDASADYKQPATRLQVRKDRSYVIFPDGPVGSCTCPDYRERAFIKGEIAACKHIIGTYACGEFPVAAEATPSEEEGASAIDWRDAEPIGVEYIPGVGEVEVYAPEVVEAYGLHICNA